MTTLSIRNANHSPLHPHNIRDFGLIAKPKTEVVVICEKIQAFFANDALYRAWVDAGPDENIGFMEYARRELEAINREIVKATELVRANS